MKGKFTVRIGNKLHVYSNYEDIPAKFDNVIEFLPEYKEGPHDDHDHEELHKLSDKLKELLKRESK